MSAAPKELDAVLAGLQKLKSQEEVLRQAYSIVIKRFRGKRFHTVWDAVRLFAKSPEELWKHPGLMDCLHQNQLLKFLLLGSGRFQKSDLSLRWTFYWNISPHQYLRVRLGKGSFINIDSWSATYGIKFGDYARGFHTKVKQ